MTSANIWWNTVNSIFIAFLWFFILFTYGNFPTTDRRLSEVENKVNAIDYHLQCPTTKCDTIVINNYFQQPVTKTKK